MNNEVITIQNMDDDINHLYSELLDKKGHYQFVNYQDQIYVLTREKSIIPIDNTESFLDSIKDDIYYETNIIMDDAIFDKNDLLLYEQYIEKYKSRIMAKKYNDKYYFGCVAVKTNNGFITTIRGKQDLNDYVLVRDVDHDNHIVNVLNKKPSLNAPLLDYILKNEKVKVIVHLHEFDDSLPYYDYGFPGTVKDSVRDNSKSFNIMYHGLVYLFDKDGNIL